MRVLVLLTTIFFISTTIWSQDYFAELQKTKKVFERPEYSMSLYYELFVQGNMRKLDQKKGHFHKSSNGYYYEMNQISIIQNSRWQMYLDNTDKVIIVRENDKEDVLDQISNLDYKKEVIDHISRSKVGSDYKYIIKFKGGMQKIYKQVDVYATQKDLSPRKVVFHHAYETDYVDQDGVYTTDFLQLEINYRDLKLKTNKSFSTAQYFKANTNGDLIVGEAYKSYRLIDQRLKLDEK